MIDCLVSDRLIRDPMLQTGKSGKPYCQFLLSAAIQDSEPVVISGIGFSEVTERIARLQKGDALCVAGALKPSSWADKVSGELKHGLSIVANQSLSIYDIKKRKPTPKPDSPAGSPASGNSPNAYNDEIDF